MMSYDENIQIKLRNISLEGTLIIPENATGLVVFVHGSGSSRHSPRNNFVAAKLRETGLGTLLLDLLTPEEDVIYENCFNINLLTNRINDVFDWLKSKVETMELNIGLFGASTGAAAALQLAAKLNDSIKAVVSRGGRTDLANEHLNQVVAPTMFIVGSLDDYVVLLNEESFEMLHCLKELVIIPDATHLFEEPGTLEKVADFAADWFNKYL